MKKSNLKEMFLLPILIFITEILNSIILIVLGFLSENDAVRYAVLAILSLLMYYYIGKKIIVKLNDNKIRRCSFCITAVLIMLSYPFSEFLTRKTGVYFICHMLACSPIANLMVMPFGLIDTPYEIAILLNALFAPVNVVLICLFSKIKTKSKSDRTEDEYLS